jgi:soluble lytic murein transglycosylase-like protein
MPKSQRPSPTGSRPIACLLLVAGTALSARADCIDDAAQRHRVNALVLRAIGWQESRLRPDAVGRNTNGTIDLGAFQINSVHLPALARLGIAPEALADGCVCADVAAWHYRRQVDRLGNTWAAVGAYHSATPARAAGYANRIAAILTRWQVLPPAPPPFPAAP